MLKKIVHLNSCFRKIEDFFVFEDLPLFETANGQIWLFLTLVTLCTILLRDLLSELLIRFGYILMKKIIDINKN